MKNIIFSTVELNSKGNLATAFSVFALCEISITPLCSRSPALFIAFSLVIIVALMRVYYMNVSHLTLYDEYVTGVSLTPSLLPARHSFKLSYDEIVFVEARGNAVRIYYDGGNFTVQTRGTSLWVARLIKEKKSASAQIK